MSDECPYCRGHEKYQAKLEAENERLKRARDLSNEAWKLMVDATRDERDRYRTALEEVEKASCGDIRKNCHHMGEICRAIARRALTSTTPPPAAETKHGGPPMTLAECVAAESPAAAPPVALRPAREVVHTWLSQCGLRFWCSETCDPDCDSLAAAIEADRTQRTGLDPAIELLRDWENITNTDEHVRWRKKRDAFLAAQPRGGKL